MVIRRVGPLSVAKIAGVLYALLGLIIGAFFSLMALAGAFSRGPADSPFFPAIFGLAGVLVLPVMYGCLGFISTLVMSWLYNVLAGAVGGIEVDIH